MLLGSRSNLRLCVGPTLFFVVAMAEVEGEGPLPPDGDIPPPLLATPVNEKDSREW